MLAQIFLLMDLPFKSNSGELVETDPATNNFTGFGLSEDQLVQI